MHTMTRIHSITPWLALAAAPALALARDPSAATAPSADQAAELAKKLQNPVAALVSVPFQNNFDFGAGPDGDGFQYKLNFQPVIPMSISEDWNVISRTIIPFIDQQDIVGTSSQSGLGDTVQSFFFSPKEPTAGGLIWGVGPVLQLPTATDDLLGEEQWGVGPTAVLLTQKDGWTAGALLNHIWSVTGENSRSDVNRSFIQPFLSYTTKTQTTLGVNTESSYDWEREQWSLPLNLTVQQLVKVGGLPLALQLGGRYYADGPESGPEWGLRFTVSMLFPK